MEVLAREADALAGEIDEERFRHVAGMEPDPALARAFTARSRAAHRDTVAALRAGGHEQIAAAVAALRAERAQAEHEEAWRAADARATGTGLRGPAPLAALEIALVRERDPDRRDALAAAAAEAMREPARAREAAVETRARARAEVGLVPDWNAVVQGDDVLAASDDAWRDVAAFVVRRELGNRGERSLARADLLHVLALSRWNGQFKPGMLPVALRMTLERVGLDAARIRVDGDDRPAKWPGAHAVGARVSFRPRGGAGDWQDLLAAVGRAISAAAQPPHARDPELAGALAWALGSLVLEPRWLADRADVERPNARDVMRDLALRRLFALRADAAALRVAAEVERGLSGAAWRDAHRDALLAATGAAWDPVRASRDGRADVLAASIRGAAAGERLRVELRERFDEDWWRNPRTAGHLAGLLAAGRLPEGDAPPAAVAARMLVAKLDGGG